MRAIYPSVSAPGRQDRLKQELITLLEGQSGLNLGPTAGTTDSAAPVANSGIEQLIKEQLAAFAELTSKQFAMMQHYTVPALMAVAVEPEATTVETTPQQQEYLQSFVARYNKRTQESKRLTQKHRGHLADPRVAAGFRAEWKELIYPLSIERSSGSKLWDVDGNEYIDLVNSFGATMFGHRPQFVQDAVARQLFEGFEIGPQTPLAGKVAEVLCEMTGMERAAFTNEGSEAVLAALRVARTVTNRKKIVFFAGDYDRVFDEATDTMILEYGSPASLDIIRAHAGELAAVLVEPVQSRHPHLVPVQFLKELRKITEEHEIALVFDEVVTGFRTHPGGAQALFNIRADMAAYGKAIGGGMPVGVLAGSAKYLDALDGGMWQYGDASFPEAGVTFFADTFVRHPLAMAATWAVLNHLKQKGPRLQEELSEKTGRLVRSLNELFQANAVPTHIESFRSIFYFAFPYDQRLASLLYYHLRERGVYIQEGLPCFLTTAHSEEDLEQIVGAFRDSIAEMQQGGLLAAPEGTEQVPAAMAGAIPMPHPAPAKPLGLLRERAEHVPATPALAIPMSHPACAMLWGVRIGQAEACPTLSMPLGLLRMVAAPMPREAEHVPTTMAIAIPMPHPAAAMPWGPQRMLAAPIPFIEAEVPLTEAQLEIRLAAQSGDEESCSYNEGFGIHFKGDLNEPALQQSLELVVNRHEALRSTLSESGVSMRILQHVDVPFRVIDISTLGEEERDRRIARLKVEDAETAFDLVHGPLVRAQLVRIAAEEHWLLLTAHHLVCDGWSINIILNELASLYSAQGEARAEELPKPMSFAEYARSQASQRADLEVEDYWASEFSAPVAPLELPVDRPRPALKSYHGATAVAKISEPQYGAIKRAGAESNATLLDTLLAGFQALLSRLTGQSDIVVGIPAAAQAVLADETLVGHCVKLLAIRAKATGDVKFSELLATTKRKLIEAYEHQSYAYGTLVRKLAIPRSPSRLPLIEVQFNLKSSGDEPDFSGLECKVEPSAKRFVNFDLSLNVVESADGLALYCDYNTDIFDETTIQRWLQSFENLLLAFAADPSQFLSNLSLLNDAERHKLLYDWNATSESYPKDKSFDRIFSEQASLAPESTAVRDGSRTLTYAELDKRSNQLAHWLKRQGVGNGTLTGISLEPSIEMLVAVLAISKTGAAYVPLHPGYPQERLEFIRQDAALPLVLSFENWPHLGQECEEPLPALDADRLAYVIYMSASKGVEIGQRALVNLLWSMQRRPGISAEDKLLAVTAGLELFLPLTVGAEVVIASREARGDGHALMELIEAGGITIMQATPTTWKLILDAGWTGSPNLKVVCGGEELTRDLANELVRHAGSVWNMYGTTETTSWSTCEQVSAGEGPVSIGKPIGNTFAYVLDTQGRPAPLGVPGELYIGGDGLAGGYHNRAELTVERFFLNPFLRNASARLYRTGDLVRFLPDGRLIYLGRLDNQVKIRGHRTELGEIESALLKQAAVRDAAVILREDQAGEKRLVAYIVAAEDDAVAVRTNLEQCLPEYMIPSLFVFVDSLPPTPNGKVDRKALAALPFHTR